MPLEEILKGGPGMVHRRMGRHGGEGRVAGLAEKERGDAEPLARAHHTDGALHTALVNAVDGRLAVGDHKESAAEIGLTCQTRPRRYTVLDGDIGHQVQVVPLRGSGTGTRV